jgi:hypothetical protein
LEVRIDRMRRGGRARATPAAVTGVRPEELAPREVAAELRALLAAGARLRPAGLARKDPRRLLGPRYLPRHAVRLFDATYYLTGYRRDADINFLVAYVALRERAGRVRAVYPRIVYKDPSLVWRVATHVIRTADENWIGKGEVRRERRDGWEVLSSVEETTNLPYEIQAALDEVSRRERLVRDDDAVPLVLRAGPTDRIRPYADFTRPRERAAAKGRVNGGRPVAFFARRGDPASLRFAPGYGPDFARGVLEVAHSGSRLYGGAVRKFRILSRNRQVQYQFLAAPRHVWVNPPQTLTREITTYGVRPLDVPADEDVFVPGYEYHYLDDTSDPPALYSQIPDGYAGAPSEVSPMRADASAWIEALPVTRAFRREVLGERRGRSR